MRLIACAILIHAGILGVGLGYLSRPGVASWAGPMGGALYFLGLVLFGIEYFRRTAAPSREEVHGEKRVSSSNNAGQ